MMRAFHYLLIFFVLLAEVAVADDATADAEWGTLNGQVLFEGELPFVQKLDESLLIDGQSKGIANVVVYLSRRPERIHPSLIQSPNPEENEAANDGNADGPTEIKIEITNNRFVPHVSVVRTGIPIRVISHDPIEHAIRTCPVRGQPLHCVIPANQKSGVSLPRQLIPEKLPLKVIDPDNPLLSAYWVVLDHPYASVTDKNGKFTIPQLPIGDHTFVIYHERYGFLKKGYHVKVNEGMNELPPLSVGPP